MQAIRVAIFLVSVLITVYGRENTIWNYIDEGPEDDLPMPPDVSDCEDVDPNQMKKNNIFWLNVRNHFIPAYCEVNDAGTKYTVFQRRLNGSVSFFRRWNMYKLGFGEIRKEFWWGLLPLSILTSRFKYKLRVELEAFDGTKAFAEYDEFVVGNEDSKFMLTVSGFKGSAGDSLMPHHNKMPFSTLDVDNDKSTDNCAEIYHGGWWYNNCHTSNLNGLYYLGKQKPFADGVNWLAFRGYQESVKSTKMMIARIN